MHQNEEDRAHFLFFMAGDNSEHEVDEIDIL